MRRILRMVSNIMVRSERVLTEKRSVCCWLSKYLKFRIVEIEEIILFFKLPLNKSIASTQVF